MKLLTLLGITSVAAHSNLIYPKPRNAIDSQDPRWAGGKSPDTWGGPPANDQRPCACRNGTDICDIGQTCLWMSVGCSIGCKECDGGVINNKSVGANPNIIDRCGSGMKATVNDPLLRTTNRECVGDCVGSEKDWTRCSAPIDSARSPGPLL